MTIPMQEEVSQEDLIRLCEEIWNNYKNGNENLELFNREGKNQYASKMLKDLKKKESILVEQVKKELMPIFNKIDEEENELMASIESVRFFLLLKILRKRPKKF